SIIPKKPERKQYCYEVLERTGEDGADAVIEQITQAPTNDDRKALFEVLRELHDAVPALTRMLGDSRWFVVRNAADLLGEKIATPDAVQKLVKMAGVEGRLFKKKSTGFRVAAVQALGEAKTPAAMTALKELVADKDREVRETAARALAHASR